MRRLSVKRWGCLAVVLLAGALTLDPSRAATPAGKGQSGASEQFVDGIAAVVNKQVITMRQVRAEASVAREQMRRQGIPVPDEAVLQRQVLQRLINLELERQQAERYNISITDAQVEQAVQSVAERNRLTVARLRQEVERTGVSWSTYLGNLRNDIRRDMLRQRAVDNTVNITDAEIDAFLRSQAGQAGVQASLQPAPAPAPAEQPRPQPQAGPAILGLAQILVQVPESASPSQVQSLRSKAEDLLARVRGGADFAGVAASSSDGPEALEGGTLGVRPVEGWPELFVQATQNLKEGQVSGIVQSGAGFHILKVLTRGRPASAADRPRPAPAPAPAPQAQPQIPVNGPMMVTQTRARHILVKTSQVMTDDQARQRLEQVRQRIVNGESFEDMAKRYSEDSTAPLGGDLGWLSPGETVPGFERAMDALEPGQISAPVQSQFGWHLIQVIERRTEDMAEEFKRMRARQILFERRIEPAFEDWLNRIRGQAYIDNRLDPSANRNVRR